MSAWTREASYQFLGHRDYVHGSSMLLSMLEAIAAYAGREAFAPARIKMFKILNELTSHGLLECLPTSQAPGHPRLAHAAARLDLDTEKGRLTALVFPQPNQVVRDRLTTYDAANYVERVEAGPGVNGSARLTGIKDMIDLLRGVVEANRQLILQQSDEPKKIQKMRWAYLADFGILPDADFSRALDIEFTPKIVVARERQRFIVKTFHVPGWGGGFRADMCFSQQLST